MSYTDQQLRAADAEFEPLTILNRLHAAAVVAFALMSAFPAYFMMFPLRLNHLAALLLVGTFGAMALAFRRVPRISAGNAALGYMLVVYGCLVVSASALLSAISARDPIDAYSYALRFILGAILVVAVPAFAIDRAGRARWITKSLILGGTASSLLALIGYWLPVIGASTIGVGRRAESLFDHPNQFGMVVLALFPLALAYALEAPKRPLRWLVCGAIASGVVLSGSFVNTLLLVAGTALLLFSVYSNSLSLRRVVLGQTAILLLAGSIALIGPDRLAAASPRVAGMLSAVQASGDLSARLPSVDERLGLYRTALETWREHPLLGVGADNAHHYLTRPSGTPISHAHNMFINAALSTGIIGLLALAVLAIGWVLTAFQLLTLRIAKASDALLSKGVGTALILLFLSNQSSDSLSGTVIYPLWALLGIAFALAAANEVGGVKS